MMNGAESNRKPSRFPDSFILVPKTAKKKDRPSACGPVLHVFQLPANRYPFPQTDRIRAGLDGSFSIFCRRCRICTAITRRQSNGSSPQTVRYSSSADRILSGLFRRNPKNR